MPKALFRKYFFLIFGVFVAVLGICAFSTQYLMKFQMDRFFKSQAADLLRQIESYPGDKIAYVQELNEENGKLHSPVHLELRAIGDSAQPLFGPHVVQLIRIDGRDMEFVLSLAPPSPERGPMRPRSHRGPGGLPLIPFLALIFAVLLASALSVLLIYRSFRDKAELAKSVLGKMQNGDLKARFPISKWDEASQIFKLYNDMADEIERLVERLRQNEQTRVMLLQELAHDLRTPVASLKNVIEALHFDESRLNQTTKEELKDVALHEADYLERLVEDLLFLALVLEPKYKNESERISVAELLANQMAASSKAYPNINGRLLEKTTKNGKAFVVGKPHLMRRLFRNALENAYSFAKSEVTVTMASVEGCLEVLIRDDGPGLTEEGLASFGKKKASRYGSQVNGRISVGLGSVIIQTIATAHSGSASIRNVIAQDGTTVGAEVRIAIGTV